MVEYSVVGCVQALTALQNRKRKWKYPEDLEYPEASKEDDWAVLTKLGSSICMAWAHESSLDWWEQIILTTWNDQQWLETFQMTREMFYHIISILGPHIVRRDTNMCWAILPDKRVAMAIMKLATPTSLRYIANQFGLAPCTPGLATCEVCQMLKDMAANKFIHLANPKQVIDGFNAKGFLNCVGALDSIHIPVLYTSGRGRSFTNRKGFASVILQAVVDHRSWFTNFFTRWAGSVHDMHMFRNSPLPGLVEKEHYTPRVHKTVIAGVGIPPVILKDAAYPLKSWLMKPYGGNVTDPQKLVFNYCLSSCRMAIGCAFGQLKGQWRALMCQLELEPENIMAFVVAAC
ncbi:putative nuclease HARBI1 [Alligator mississippiensis]|uniref:Nuclease HARBI1 n=1 Tax=Alligator mississippiensis TaxID=8496 RepID=A0A151NWZ3_ALLMI|nr:putative nuclease HARBI1 [Alligator mississippiensis]